MDEPVRVEPGLTGVQRLVLQHILEHPGATIQSVAVRLGVSHSTATFHLQALKRLGMLTQLREGRELRHFKAGTPQEYLRSVLDDERKERLLRTLCSGDASRLTINQIARASQLPFPFVKRTLLQWAGMGLVQLERRHYRYVVHADAQRLQELAMPAPLVNSIKASHPLK